MELQFVLVLLGTISALISLGVAAWRWGFDSRDGFVPAARPA